MSLAVAIASIPAGAQAPETPRGDARAEAPPAGEPPPEEAPAAPLPPAPSDIEVITIRGRQHENLLQQTAVSVTSFDAKDLQDLRIQNISDLAEYTPNLDIKSRSAASNPNLFVRGIGLKDYNANAAGAVAIYQDGININSPAIQLFQLYDVESIEVLRGPQGSGSGRNATAGAILINSAKPDGLFGGSASFTYGNYNTLQAEGAINLPLVDEMLSARLAFTANFADGNTDNECANWDPESIGLPRLTKETIEAAWAREIADGSRARFRGTETYPRYGVENPEPDPLDRPLTTDDVCITEPPGSLLVGRHPNYLAEPIWQPAKENNPAVRTLEDFQGLEERVNDVNNWAARGLLRFQPFDDMDWLLNAHGGRNRSGSRHLQMLGATAVLERGVLAESQDPQTEAVAAANFHKHGGVGREGVGIADGLYGLDSNSETLTSGGRRGDDPFSGWYDSDGAEDLDAYGLSLRGGWDLGSVVVTSLSGYEWYDRLVEDEGDATPELSFPGDYSDSAWQVSQELRVEGEGERHRWKIGGFLLQEKLTAFNVFPTTESYRQLEQSFDQELLSLAPYAGGRYELTEELSLESGVRYNVERKDFTLKSEAAGRPAIDEQQESKTWTGVTGDATLSYAPFWGVLDRIQNDSLNLYAKYSRGMKGGHFNASLTIKGAEPEAKIIPAEPEFIHAVEVGFKSGWFDDRLVLNAAGFRYWYKDFQVFEISNSAGSIPLPLLLNSDARVLGAEVELQARPLPGLSLQAAFGWLDARFGDFVVTKAIIGRRGVPSDVPFDYSGNPLISAPRYDVSAIVEYTIPLSRFGSLTPQYDFSWRSTAYFDPAALEPISQAPYWLHNARLAYRTPDGRIEVAGWVQNFLNEQYKVDAFDLSLQYFTVLEVWGDPRTYGLTVTFTW